MGSRNGQDGDVEEGLVTGIVANWSRQTMGNNNCVKKKHARQTEGHPYICTMSAILTIHDATYRTDPDPSSRRAIQNLPHAAQPKPETCSSRRAIQNLPHAAQPCSETRAAVVSGPSSRDAHYSDLWRRLRYRSWGKFVPSALAKAEVAQGSGSCL